MGTTPASEGSNWEKEGLVEQKMGLPGSGSSFSETSWGKNLWVPTLRGDLDGCLELLHVLTLLSIRNPDFLIAKAPFSPKALRELSSRVC